jgi:hypothetical protein
MSRQALEAQKCKAIAFSCVGGSDDQNKLFRTPKKWKSEIWLNAWEQKAENRKQKAENRKQKTENRIHAMWQQAFKEEVEEDRSIVRQ